MIDIVDFDTCQQVYDKGYRGNAGRKFPVIYNTERWMLKFPENTKHFAGGHLPSYTSSPLSEYIGSKIYESLGIDVHEVVLGKRDGKIVVGCKDFTTSGELIEFSMLKNTVSEDYLIGSCGSSGQGEYLDDVMRVLREAKSIAPIREPLTNHFWDMFIVDALILNNDRNNGNWGVLATRRANVIAPVYDNGNAFFNKRNPSVTGRRLQDEGALLQDALKTSVSFFTDRDGRHIHPCEYIESAVNHECNCALLRIVERINMDEIARIIDEIPETAYGLQVTTNNQKEYYKRIVSKVYNDCLVPTARNVAGRVHFLANICVK